MAACPCLEVSCPFVDAGCAFRAARRDMDDHSGDMGAHFLLLMTTVAQVKAECASIKTDSSSLQLYVSILQPSGDAGDREWVSSRTFPAAEEYEESTYTGQMRGGKFHGFGRLSSATGKSYDGQWKEGKKCGQGLYKWSDGDSYEGHFKDGGLHGQGVFKHSNGEILEGTWRDCKKQGGFVFTKADGTRYKSFYKNGTMTRETPIP
ncbi:hypothetical protein B484DRAFT_391897 [Ochromonadaceae sp. CCMP2298]|nr:hypothetical protein B484DRAFT_391897 [Ochromonadaceae sp. CCMP2298]